MADPSWPSSVPSEPNIDGYEEKIVPNLATFQPDVGPPSSWRRSTLAGATIQATIPLLTATIRNDFLTFYRTTLKDGSLPFLWTNPSYGVSGRYQFDPQQPPTLTAIGPTSWRMSMTLFKLS